uniref:Uncharacterized protein n=1 Tax=Pararge aegeria TaxID=116150 RepID=S4PCW9_9NEOP
MSPAPTSSAGKTVMKSRSVNIKSGTNSHYKFCVKTSCSVEQCMATTLHRVCSRSTSCCTLRTRHGSKPVARVHTA